MDQINKKERFPCHSETISRMLFFLNVVSPSLLYPSNLFDMKRGIKKIKTKEKTQKDSQEKREWAGQTFNKLTWSIFHKVKMKQPADVFQDCLTRWQYIPTSIIVAALTAWNYGSIQIRTLEQKSGTSVLFSVTFKTDIQRLCFGSFALFLSWFNISQL